MESKRNSTASALPTAPDEPQQGDLPENRRSFFANGLIALGASTCPMTSGLASTTAKTSQENNARFESGLAVLKQIGGKNYDVQLKRLAELAPDMARFTVEFGYGDLLSRPGLDLAHRELSTVAMLIAMGSVQPQLKYHMHGFLNVGGQPVELVELLILSVAMSGFPGAINAIGLVREVFGERGIAITPVQGVPEPERNRLSAGLSYLDRMGVDLGQAGSATAAPELERWTFEFAVGDIFSRSRLSEKQKHLAAISMLSALGNHSLALRFHLAAALLNGVTQGEIVETLMQISVYAGFPAALNAFFLATDLFKEGANPSLPVGWLQSTQALIQTESESNALRRERGSQTLAKTSQLSGDTVIKSFDDIAPVLGKILLEHAYGDIFQRSGIDPKTRELTAISALAAVASKTTEMPLRVHLAAALNVGASRTEILETLYNLLPYCGYPSVRQAVGIAVEEFAKRDAVSQ